MRLMNGGLMAALMAGAVIGAAGCSSDGDNDRRTRRDPVYRNDGGDYRSQREKLDRAQGDYADRDRDGIRDGVEDRNRDGVRDGDQNNGRRRRTDSDLYR